MFVCGILRVSETGVPSRWHCPQSFGTSTVEVGRARRQRAFDVVRPVAGLAARCVPVAARRTPSRGGWPVERGLVGMTVAALHRGAASPGAVASSDRRRCGTRRTPARRGATRGARRRRTGAASPPPSDPFGGRYRDSPGMRSSRAESCCPAPARCTAAGPPPPREELTSSRPVEI